MFKKLISSLIIVMFILGLSIQDQANAKDSVELNFANPLYDDKEVLNYLLWTADKKLENDVIELQKTFDLSDKQMEKLRDWGINEREMVVKEIAQLSTTESQNVDIFNRIASDVFQQRNNAIKDILGEKFPLFEEWIANWWANEKVYRDNWIASRSSINADINRVSGIFATQYHPNTSGAYEVALPDKYVKFANLGWTSSIPATLRSTYATGPYSVNVYNPATNRSVTNVRVDEVGPWNTDDNYWDARYGNNPRRQFATLPLGTPQAYQAYINGHNGGKDQSGRKVLNPAGIDLTPRVATDLGLGTYQNAWIDVRYEYLP